MLRIDYYAAPNCNALCSSGSGTPKGNGTPECNCAEEAKITMTLTAGSHKYGFDYGYGLQKEMGYGSGDLTYRGANIVEFDSVKGGFWVGDQKCPTLLSFYSNLNDISDIKIRVNGKNYIFKVVSGYKSYFYCNDLVFTHTGVYNIEFLN